MGFVVTNIKQYNGRKILTGSREILSGESVTQLFKLDSPGYISSIALEVNSDEVVCSVFKTGVKTLFTGDQYSTDIQDAWIFGQEIHRDKNSGGALNMLLGEGNTAYGLIKIPNLNAVVGSNNINSACLELFAARPIGIYGTQKDNMYEVMENVIAEAYALLKNWNAGIGGAGGAWIAAANAGEVTWNSAVHGSVLWDTPGAKGAGDISGVIGKSRNKYGSVIPQKEIAMILDLDSYKVWQMATGTNHGFKINLKTTASGPNGFRYLEVFSSDHSEADFRPRLHVGVDYGDGTTKFLMQNIQGANSLSYINFDSPIFIDSTEGLVIALNNYSTASQNVNIKVGVLV